MQQWKWLTTTTFKQIGATSNIRWVKDFYCAFQRWVIFFNSSRPSHWPISISVIILVISWNYLIRLSYYNWYGCRTDILYNITHRKDDTRLVGMKYAHFSSAANFINPRLWTHVQMIIASWSRVFNILISMNMKMYVIVFSFYFRRFLTWICNITKFSSRNFI